MLASTIPLGPLVEPFDVRDGTDVVTVLRRHRAPAGKVTLSYRRRGGGVGMVTIDDTERLSVLR